MQNYHINGGRAHTGTPISFRFRDIDHTLFCNWKYSHTTNFLGSCYGAGLKLYTKPDTRLIYLVLKFQSPPTFGFRVMHVQSFEKQAHAG